MLHLDLDEYTVRAPYDPVTTIEQCLSAAQFFGVAAKFATVSDEASQHGCSIRNPRKCEGNRCDVVWNVANAKLAPDVKYDGSHWNIGALRPTGSAPH